MTDIEIAQKAQLKTINKIAEEAGIPEESCFVTASELCACIEALATSEAPEVRVSVDAVGV